MRVVGVAEWLVFGTGNAMTTASRGRPSGRGPGPGSDRPRGAAPAPTRAVGSPNRGFLPHLSVPAGLRCAAPGCWVQAMPGPRARVPVLALPVFGQAQGHRAEGRSGIRVHLAVAAAWVVHLASVPAAIPHQDGAPVASPWAPFAMRLDLAAWAAAGETRKRRPRGRAMHRRWPPHR